MKIPSRRRSQLVKILGVTTILAGLGATGMARAASAVADQAADPAMTSPADEAGGGLTEIVVTATRSAQSIQKVPISMQALGAETLAERQVKGLSDFATLLQSVSFEGIGPGRNTAFFRGIVPAGGV